jgi:hypothetical protein
MKKPKTTFSRFMGIFPGDGSFCASGRAFRNAAPGNKKTRLSAGVAASRDGGNGVQLAGERSDLFVGQRRDAGARGHRHP